LCVSRSIRERWISGVGVAGGGVAGSRVSGEGGKFGGLSGWVVVGDGVVLVVGSIISVVGRRCRSELSVVGLIFGSVGVAVVVVLKVGEGGGGRVMGLSVRRGVVALVSAVVASIRRGACSRSSGCDGPVDCVQQAFVAEQPSGWKVSLLGVLGGRLVGAVGGRGLLPLASAAAGGRKSLPGAVQMRE